MHFKVSLIFLICLLSAGCESDSKAANQKSMEKKTESPFDWQGHRGARGLLPENSIPAFLLALQYPKVTTLELDIAVSKDSQLIVSHEPWMSHQICSGPNGNPVTEEDEEDLAIFQLTAQEVQQYDCGSRGNERFPEQKPMKVRKPLFSELVKAAEARAGELERPLPKYNIEIKSRPEWDNFRTPDPLTFARLLLEAIDRLGIRERACIQSFDPRALEATHELDPDMTTAYLVEELDSLDDNLDKLSFTPTVYSPYYMLVTANMIKEIHDRGMLIIPWTVNDSENMAALKALGVDGLITDYPDRIP